MKKISTCSHIIWTYCLCAFSCFLPLTMSPRYTKGRMENQPNDITHRNPYLAVFTRIPSSLQVTDLPPTKLENALAAAESFQQITVSRSTSPSPKSSLL
ncbi:hypothetical protein BC941DRAFT_422484 [Chlamydoabsidia padenii]|nr:hypothetical protein BC941DRAFT_422484 [Chlamydoabsidia padenii]